MSSTKITFFTDTVEGFYNVLTILQSKYNNKITIGRQDKNITVSDLQHLSSSLRSYSSLLGPDNGLISLNPSTHHQISFTNET